MRYAYCLKNGYVIDPARGIDSVEDVYIYKNKIADAPEANTTVEAAEVIDASGCLVLPGLIDFHTHIYHRHTAFGYPPDLSLIPNCVTSAVDAGSAGSASFAGFYKDIISSSDVTVKAFVNVGVFGVATNRFVENLNPDTFDVSALEALLGKYPDHILGLKLRMGKNFTGQYGLEPLRRIKEIARELGAVMNVHVVEPEQPLDEILSFFDKGDILTHCFQNMGGVHNILDGSGRVRSAVKDARARGVIFDVGQARALYDYNVISRAFDDGFMPDTLSSDTTTSSVYQTSLHSLLYVMTTFLALGMPLREVVRAVTETPAGLMGLKGKIGTLAPGADADVAILKFRESPMKMTDPAGHTIEGNRLFVPKMTIKGGRTAYRRIDFTF